MKVGLSESSYRRRLQTAMRCCSHVVVNVMVKRRDKRSRHVGVGETNVSEPLETHRKFNVDTETRAAD
jgi:hypothetical protein